MPAKSKLDLGTIRTNRNVVSRNYWKDRMAGHEFTAYFDTRIAAEATSGGNYATYAVVAPDNVVGHLTGLAASDEAKHIVLLSVLNVLAQKCSSYTDICVFSAGYPIDNQRSSSVIPVRVKDVGKMSFTQFVSVVKDHMIKDLKHSHYPLEKILGKEHGELKEIPSLGILVEDIQEHTVFDILSPELLFAFRIKDGCRLTIRYNVHKFDKLYISRLTSLYWGLLERLIVHSDTIIDDVDLLTAEDRRQLIDGFNDTEGAYPHNETIISLFEAQVQNALDTVAVVYEGRVLTYRELNEQANRLAHYLRDKYAIRPDDLVGIMAARSEKMIIGLLGILKAGAAYIPVDPSYPKERIEYILQDSDARVLLVSDVLRNDIVFHGDIVNLDGIDSDQVANPVPVNTPKDLCYLIYTSGSTGKPKGVMISHYNVLNFMAGLSHKITVNKDDCMLAVTSISFDISVLELFWTLCQGIQVLIHPADISFNSLDRYMPDEDLSLDFSLFFFSSYNNKKKDKYRLLMESARFADQAGFKAVWTPERHFHEFGGLYPNPSVTSAALAMITKQVELRSGSVVTPLHDAIRIAEEWAVVDNLSRGRVGLSFASGWNPNDFTLSKGDYKDRQKIMYQQIEEIKKLWRGESIKRIDRAGKEIILRVFPAPLQKELPVWITSSGNEETFKSAGAQGANLLTHFLGQDIDDLARKIKLYRESRIQHGYEGHTGKIALMLHTYIGDDINEVEKLVEQPFVEYLKSSIGLSRILLEETGVKAEEIPAERMENILQNAFRRYYKTGSLIGTRSSCSAMLQRLKEIGVDEIACLVDFGVEENKVMDGLQHLKVLKDLFSRRNNRVHKPVTMLQSTPSFIQLTQEGNGSKKLLSSLRALLLGGESVPVQLVRNLKRENKVEIYNMYGPTETTIWSCMHKFPANTEKVSVGKPMLNTQVYILDKMLRPVPGGMTGDLYIGGEGLSRGYRKREDLTAERFIDDPFHPGRKIYRTGDIARWLEDGTIELAGREDQQVKIRGYRIELGEIESFLAGHVSVKEAVVVVRERNGDKYLAGYYTAKGSVREADLRNYLSAKLPPYMVPSYLVLLDRLPLTPNGKMDRKALPDPGVRNLEMIIAPSGDIEKELAGIWAGILHLEEDRIGVHDDFFAVGGHSIMAVRLIHSIEQHFSVTISLRQMFDNATIEKQAKLIGSNMNKDVERILRTEKKEYYPASSAQERLYYEQMANKSSLNSNNSSVYKIKGNLNIDRIEYALSLLVKRHEGLRTRFVIYDQDIVQQIDEDTAIVLQRFDQNDYSTVEETFHDFVKPLDLSTGHLVRFGLYKQDETTHFLLIDIHHIVCDGISVNILMNDFKNIYQGNKLAPTDVKYIDYAHWQNAQKKGLQKEREYWKGQLSGEWQRINMPLLQSREEAEIYLAERSILTIEGDLYHEIKKAAVEWGVSNFMLQLSVFYLLLSKISGNTDIIIGTDAIGRSRPSLMNVVGTFVNVLPLRMQISEQHSFETFLLAVKHAVLEAFDNQEYQFDQMSTLLGPGERKQLVDIYFSSTDFWKKEVEINELEFTPLKIGKPVCTTRYELELNIDDTDGKLYLTFIYSTALYDNPTIGLFMQYYHNILTAILKDKLIDIESIELESSLHTVAL